MHGQNHIKNYFLILVAIFNTKHRFIRGEIFAK